MFLMMIGGCGSANHYLAGSHCTVEKRCILRRQKLEPPESESIELEDAEDGWAGDEGGDDGGRASASAREKRFIS